MAETTVKLDTADLFWLCELLSDTAFMAKLENHSGATRIERVLKQLKGESDGY